MNEHWKLRFMGLAAHVSSWSKEEKKVGATLVDKHRRVVGTGYNGAPPCIDDITINPRNSDYLVCHAEPNALANSKGSELTLFVTEFPCLHCAMAIVGSGRVVEVVSKPLDPLAQGRWAESQRAADNLLRSFNITVSYINVGM
jgi:dCMP deaminase